MKPALPALGAWLREGPEEEHVKEKEGAQGDEEEGALFAFWLLFSSSENLLHNFNVTLEIG